MLPGALRRVLGVKRGAAVAVVAVGATVDRDDVGLAAAEHDPRCDGLGVVVAANESGERVVFEAGIGQQVRWRLRQRRRGEGAQAQPERRYTMPALSRIISPKVSIPSILSPVVPYCFRRCTLARLGP